jgi:hypothetical protein
MLHRLCALTALAALFVMVGPPRTSADDAKATASLTKGTVELKSAGPLAFGPHGILFVGDPQAAVIYAIDTGDSTAPETKKQPKVEGIDAKIASLLGTETDEVRINDLAVNPISGTTYFSVARGKGPAAPAVLVRVTGEGKLSELSLKNVKSAKTEIANPPPAGKGKGRRAPSRLESITHLAFVKGRVIVAGLSNEEFASKLRAIPFPFEKGGTATSVEIFHGAHGGLETHSPVRVFAPYQIKGEDHLLAAYTCTPLVKFPVGDLKAGAKIRGTTIAELGNRNRPLSMIVYKKGGKDYVLMANSSRGMMKIPLEGITKVDPITAPVRGTAGLKYDTIEDLKGVQKLDAFGNNHAVVLIRTGGKLNLTTIELP